MRLAEHLFCALVITYQDKHTTRSSVAFGNIQDKNTGRKAPCLI